MPEKMNPTDVANAASNLAHTITSHAIIATAPDVGMALATCLSILLPPLTSAAGIISKSFADDPRDPQTCMTPDLLLFMSLLASRACSVSDRDNDTHIGAVLLNIDNYLGAMEDFTKLTGRKIDDQLSPNLVKLISEASDNGAQAADRMMAALMTGGPRSVN